MDHLRGVQQTGDNKRALLYKEKLFPFHAVSNGSPMEEKSEKWNYFFTQKKLGLQEAQQNFTYQSKYCSKSNQKNWERWKCNHLTRTSRMSTEVNISTGVSSDEKVEKNHHASSLQLAKAVESQTGVTVFRDTIRRILQRNGIVHEGSLY